MYITYFGDTVFIFHMEEYSMKKNIFYDTNTIYKLFEYKNENKEYDNINISELEKVAKSNNGYVTSIVLDEIRFKCYELNKDFNRYIEFLEYLFPNKGNWYIKSIFRKENQTLKVTIYIELLFY